MALIIPAYNEAECIEGVVRGFLGGVPELEVFVVDNGSSDRTADLARAAGATVVSEPRRGYGSACLAGIAALRDPDVVAFADGDGSNDPRDLPRLLEPIAAGRAELVIGARHRRMVRGSMTPPQQFGNWLATRLIDRVHGVRFTDLGPFRAITHSSLRALGMRDRDFGWTVEMQILAAKHGLRVEEVDVANHRRVAGRSKISGTVRGVALAGHKILTTIWRHR